MVAQSLALGRPGLQVHNVPLRMLHFLHHPPHHVPLPGEVPGRLLANHSQDPGDPAKNQDYYCLPVACCGRQRSASVGHGWS